MSGTAITVHPPSGVTLVEMLVVLTVLGVIFGVAGLALASLRMPRETAWVRMLREARARAIHTGVTVRVTIDTGSAPTAPWRDPRTVLFLPDGRAIGQGVDPLTGAPTHATH